MSTPRILRARLKDSIPRPLCSLSPQKRSARSRLSPMPEPRAIGWWRRATRQPSLGTSWLCLPTSTQRVTLASRRLTFSPYGIGSVGVSRCGRQLACPSRSALASRRSKSYWAVPMRWTGISRPRRCTKICPWCPHCSRFGIGNTAQAQAPLWCPIAKT